MQLSRTEREPVITAMREVVIINIALIINRRVLELGIPSHETLDAGEKVEQLVTRIGESEGLTSGLEEYCALLDAHDEEPEGTTFQRVIDFMDELVPPEEEEQECP
jgi:hypothetical protein